MYHELRNYIDGISNNSERNFIKTALNYLRKSKGASGKIEKSEFFNKEDEVKILANFSDENNCWQNSINEDYYIGEGAEQKVYLIGGGKKVLKINDTIFYESWEDYLIGLLIHNFLFPNTAYELLGFHRSSDNLFGVVSQPFIFSTESTNLDDLRLFLERNGFKHKKNNDYFHPDLGIILEDLHDENVLTNNETFFFIDTVCYLKK
jgi:Serine/Threonine/Tyrosine Kinase found in polyvalent proteins